MAKGSSKPSKVTRGRASQAVVHVPTCMSELSETDGTVRPTGNRDGGTFAHSCQLYTPNCRTARRHYQRSRQEKLAIRCVFVADHSEGERAQLERESLCMPNVSDTRTWSASLGLTNEAEMLKEGQKLLRPEIWESVDSEGLASGVPSHTVDPLLSQTRDPFYHSVLLLLCLTSNRSLPLLDLNTSFFSPHVITKRLSDEKRQDSPIA